MTDNQAITRQKAEDSDILPMLAQLYQSVIAEPVPDAILSLLDQLDEKAA